MIGSRAIPHPDQALVLHKSAAEAARACAGANGVAIRAFEGVARAAALAQ